MKKPSPSTDDDGFLCLKGDRLWKWRALDAELRAVTVELDSVKRQIAVEIARHPELGALFAKQGEVGSAISIAKSELATLRAEIEEQFGVLLSDCAFDDKTGRLYHLAPDGERGEPMKTTKRRKR